MQCDHSLEKYSTVFSCGAVCFVIQCGSNFLVCRSNHAVWPFFGKLLNSTFMWCCLFSNVLVSGAVYFSRCFPKRNVAFIEFDIMHLVLFFFYMVLNKMTFVFLYFSFVFQICTSSLPRKNLHRYHTCILYELRIFFQFLLRFTPKNAQGSTRRSSNFYGG